jgi:hypothetical protein
MSQKRGGKKSRARSPSLPPDVDTYTVGSTWTDAQREHLVLFFTAINSAAEQKRHECMEAIRKYGLSIKPSHTGGGVFCAKDVPQYTRVGHYVGVVENADKFKDDGYSIGLPPITFPDGTVVPAVLSGYEQRMLPGNASMFNHSCQKFNAQFVFEDVYVKKNIEAGWKVQRLMEKKGSVIPEALLEEASEVLYTYPVVIVMTHLDDGVKADSEIRVTYNRLQASSRSGGAYFSTRRNALKSAGKGYCIAKCVCEPGGCPLKRYYVTKRSSAAVVP